MPPKIYDPEGQARRFARYQQRIAEEGGKRINIRLTARATEKLAKLCDKHGIDQTVAVNNAIMSAR